MVSKKAITSAELYDAICTKYSAPEWVVMPEVRNGTGFQKRTRTADAIAMSMYPSRGLDVLGFEIKRTRSDWTRELKNPEKAESIAQYCDRWWIVAPKGVVPVAEVPGAWGLLELKGNGLHVAKAAEKLAGLPLDRLFVASMLRSAQTLVESAERRIAEPGDQALHAKWKQGYEEGQVQEKRVSEHRIERNQKYADKVRDFESLTGIDLDTWRPMHETVAAFKFAAELERQRHALRTLHVALGGLLGEDDG